MNYIFVPNAIVLVLLGLYTWRQNPGRLSFTYLMTNLSVAVWALCFMLLHEFQALVPINPVSQLQLVSAIVFANGFIYTSLFYPGVRKMSGRWLNGLNALAGTGFTLLILFSDVVSRAELQEGAIVYIDGAGYLYYSIYLVLLGSLTVINLCISYRRYPEYRVRLAYMLTGLGLFIFLGIFFDLILVLFGNYDLLVFGHLASVFPSLFFAYAISKHDLLDIRMVVQRNTAKLIVASLIVTSLYLAFQSSFSSPALSLMLICVLGVVWAFGATPLELLLVTTVRRKFVHGWYDAEDILNRLAGALEQEKNRRDIFRQLIDELDNTFELELAHYVVAVRGDEDQLQGYELYASLGSGIAAAASAAQDAGRDPTVVATLGVDDHFIEECRARVELAGLDEFGAAVQRRFQTLGHAHPELCLVIPCFSPEILEGVLILGERSNQEPFTRKDRQFLTRLRGYVSAILYRLTPFEKLEKLYAENQKRLHEAEIELMRAEKSRAIAHATRQAHHEIRTPLNIIRLSAGRIRDAESAEKYREIIEAQVDRATEIVDETLAFTDADVDDSERVQSVDINQVLARCLRLAPETCHEKVLDLQHDLPTVQGIPGEMQVLFSNLIKNGLEAMPDAGTLRIRSRAERDEVVVAVSDTGVGIAPELREKIWEPYFSGKVTAAGNATARRGWGLTICNRIITEHKGTIQFISKPGLGTTFVVRLPVETPPASAIAVELNPDAVS
ncbi:MAG: ATP-binding protein [Gammaproteobacteria bacterium]|nr:ATP-binding protein [Gammaproteobacteria bacterium]